jgi:hypothetical protein
MFRERRRAPERGSILWFTTGGPNNTQNKNANHDTRKSDIFNKKNSLYQYL